MAERPPPDECANCGAAIPRGAKACPECGADERTGWRDPSVYDGIELSGPAFDDGRPAHRAAARRERDVNGIAWYWWAAGVAILLVFALGVIALR